MRIRTAAADDWPGIWPFFRTITAAGDTFAYATDLTSDQGRAIWMVDPPGRTIVAVDHQETVIGSATMYANRPGPGAHVASGSFMVDSAHSGRGVGRAMVEEALRWARRRGFRGMQFNAVAATNDAAVALYTKLGFEVVGTVPEGFLHPTHGYVGLHVMYRPL